MALLMCTSMFARACVHTHIHTLSLTVGLEVITENQGKCTAKCSCCANF